MSHTRTRPRPLISRSIIQNIHCRWALPSLLPSLRRIFKSSILIYFLLNKTARQLEKLGLSPHHWIVETDYSIPRMMIYLGIPPPDLVCSCSHLETYSGCSLQVYHDLTFLVIEDLRHSETEQKAWSISTNRHAFVLSHPAKQRTRVRWIKVSHPKAFFSSRERKEKYGST